MKGMTINVNLVELDAVVDQLGHDVNAAVRPAAQAMAQVLYDTVKANVAKLGKVSGNLDRAIYQAFSPRDSGERKASYNVNWNARKAPHGHLLEFGYIQRYKVYVGKDGKWYIAVRPEMRGKPRPRRSAPQSAKDAYYVPLATPRQNPAKAFVRSAASRFDQAAAAGRKKFFEVLDAK